MIRKLQEGVDCFPLKEEDFNYKREGVKSYHYQSFEGIQNTLQNS